MAKEHTVLRTHTFSTNYFLSKFSKKIILTAFLFFQILYEVYVIPIKAF